jgi:hypothetical protein
MPYYKAPDNSLHFLENESFAYLLPNGSVQITETEANAIRAANQPPAPPPDPKLVGVLFEGVMCSATRDDQNGLVAVLTDYQLETATFQPTRFEFANGNSLVITKDNIQAFIAVWKPFRKSFFLP